MTQPAAAPSLALSDGVAMPMLGFGTWRLRGKTAREALHAALGAGYRHIDTATMYGNEADVGHALAVAGLDRQEVFITTKLPASRAGRERATLGASLRALGTSHVDLWLAHSPPPSGQLVAVWREFLALQDEGRVRSVGVSNYSLAQIDRLIAVTGQAPTVNQIPWSPHQHDPALLVGHRERGVAVEGYSPLLGTDLGDPVLAGVAAAHGVTPAQVVLRWHIEHGIVVIPRSAHPDRIAANADLFGFSLSAEEVERVDGLARARKPR